MAVFEFETITQAEAMSLTVDDTVWVSTGSALRTSVLFMPASGAIAVTIDDRTVLFGPGLVDVAAEGGLKYPDLSRLLIGSDGNDDLSAEAGPPVAILGGRGNDHLLAQGPQALARGDDGDDTISGVQGAAMFGGSGSDDLTVIDDGSGRNAFVHGNLGDDVIIGSSGDEIMLGGQGSDLIVGSGGFDILVGNLGDDTILGTGDLRGEGGNDLLISQTNEPGRGDLLDGGDGADTLQGGAGGDTLSGGAGNDALSDYGGDDNLLDGGFGDDELVATAGSGTLLGADGADTLSGIDAESVSLYGGADQDLLLGSAGGDTVVGGDGDDTLDGGAGADLLYGGDGADLFVVTTPHGASAPQILDWTSDDHIHFPGTLQSPAALVTATADDVASAISQAQILGASPDVDVVAVQVGDDVMLFWQGGETSAVLVGGTLADISPASFI